MWDEPIELIEHKACLLPPSLKGKTKELEDYLDSVWKSRTLFYEDDPEKPAPERQPFLRFEITQGKVTMKAGQYVGFIQYEGHTIQILPKLFNSGQADVAFRHLLWWLDYGQRVTFPFSDLLTGSEPIENFPEALIRYFARFTHRVIASQPYHQYEELTETMSYLRGRLNTQAYINTSLSRGNWHQLVCDHEPFLFNNRLNQIIKYVTHRLIELCKLAETRRDLERVLFVLDEVDDLPCTRQDCDTVQLNRFFQEYEPCMDMCRFFLDHQYMNRQNAQQRHFCFLMPMDRVYEDLITGVVKSHFHKQFNEIRPQAKGSLTQGDEFKIRNDLLLGDSTGRIVIDTKYKVRAYEPGDRKAGINQNDMYQMVSYGLRRDTRQVVMLYPRLFDAGLVNKGPNKPLSPKPDTFTISSDLLGEQAICIRAADLTITGQVKTQKEFTEKVIQDQLLVQLAQAFLPIKYI